MSKRDVWEEKAAKATSEVARRAIRRLDFLEWLILFMAAGLAVGGGALVAWILVGSGTTAFRTVWMVSALLLFVVPGAIVWYRYRRDERDRAERMRELRREIEKEDDG